MRDGHKTGFTNSTFVSSFSNHLKFKLPTISNEIDLGNQFKLDCRKLNSKCLKSYKDQVKELRIATQMI